ncbi:hypothetical protein R3P38DRAFT_2800757 [Favolaschia claudopus]|uniref:Uncharacterized protein n=1 Tax=Favolaschia claudopus TaxID=2862362 RepID=A0AAV9ZWE9_9AGAR
MSIIYSTVEEVDDDGDLPQSTAQRRPRKTKEKPVSKITIRRSRRHFSTSSSPVGETSHVEDGDALRPRSKPKAPGSAASAHSGSQSYRMAGGSRDETVMSDTQRAIRRSEKDRAVGSSSTDDAEQGRGRRTIAPSPVSIHGSDSEPEPLSFIRKKGKNLAEEALARERARTDNTAEARQRREDAERGLRRLKDLRVEDDTEYAERLVVQEITELESLQFAQNLQAKENREYSQRVLELQREAAEEEEKSRVLDETALAAVRAPREQHDRTKARQKAVEASIANEKKARVASAALEPQARSTEQPENDSIRLIPWKDRVAGQQMRLSQLKERGYSLFQDMKIGFTASGEPIDLDSVQVLSGGSRTNAQPPQRDSIKVEMSREEKPSVPVEPNVYEKGNSKPPQPSDEGDSSSESSRSRKKSKRKGRHTSYRSDSNYTRSEDTDSAFGNSSDAQSSSRKRRKRRRKRDSSPSDSSSSSSESSYIGHRDVTKRYRFVKREPLRNEQRKGDYRPNSARIIPKEESRHERRDGGGNGNESKVRPYPKPQQGSKPPAPKTGKGKCYSCGGDHYSTDPVCPNNKTRAPILYNGREVVDDNEDEESKPSTSSESKQTSGDATEQFKHIAESSDIEDVENVDGEQYESEYTLEECSEYSEYDDDERCFHLIEEDDDAPELEIRRLVLRLGI